MRTSWKEFIKNGEYQYKDMTHKDLKDLEGSCIKNMNAFSPVDPAWHGEREVLEKVREELAKRI